jgi:prepilin-type N-terminal cleavage/methylation domain-containing protein
MRCLKDAKGMTLLEVAIALFILAIGLMGLAGLQLVTLRSDTLGHQATLATTLAKAKLTELQKVEQLTEGADRYVDKADGMIYERQWTVQADVPQPEMTTVRVQVSWRGVLADRVVTVSAVTLQTTEGGPLACGAPDPEAEDGPDQRVTSSGLSSGSDPEGGSLAERVTSGLSKGEGA